MQAPTRRHRAPRHAGPALVGLILAALAGDTLALSDALENKAQENPSELVREPRWQESGSAFPPFPRRENLVALDGKSIGARYRYWIDGRSVNLNRDRVTRFTIVMQGAGGGVNVLYEGLRCATQEFKTYGYGTSEGAFKTYPKQEWQHLKTIRDNGAKAYLVLLYDRYMCDAHGLALNLKSVRRQLGGFNLGHDAAFEQ